MDRCRESTYIERAYWEDIMPLPLAPIAGIALRYGTIAMATWAVAMVP